MTCSRDLSRLSQSNYDAVIIGGGISGAWLALHCAEVGIKVALIEQHDFASKTSSASSKLLHGGIRYLQQLQFDKVRESAFERAHYLYAAPHLSVPIPFVVPTYKDFKRSKFFLSCGMLSYRALCFGENKIMSERFDKLPSPTSISNHQLNKIYDLSTTQHTGAVVFHECHLYDSERTVLAVLKTAQQKGAHIYNYVTAKNLLREGNKVTGVNAFDTQTAQTIEIQSNLVINAAGPWIDDINSSISSQKAPSISGFAVGSHIITRKQITDHAIAITTKHQSNAKLDRGGRHVFIIPWRGHSLIGTSYHETNHPEVTELQANEVQQLLEAVNESLPNIDLKSSDLISGYSGLYPLQTDNIQRSVYQGSGEYQIIDHTSSDQIDGLITALGAKFTTGRILSQKTMPLVVSKLMSTVSSKPELKIRDYIKNNKTNKTKLHNSQYPNYTEFVENKQTQYSGSYSANTIRHLSHNYGSEIDEFMTFIADKPDYQTPITTDQPDVMGQIAWAVQHEMAITLEDALYRRTSIGLLGITSTEIENVAQLMATLLSWDAETQQAQIEQLKQRQARIKQALDGTLDDI